MVNPKEYGAWFVLFIIALILVVGGLGGNMGKLLAVALAPDLLSVLPPKGTF
jgi:hypothetical protein